MVIQTASPESRLIAQAAAGDYRAMAAEQLAERAMYGYPPWSRLISVMLRHADREILNTAARRFGELLRAGFDLPVSHTGYPPHNGKESKVTVLGPQPPVVEKIKGAYALLFLLKIPRAEPMSAMRETLQEAVGILLADRAMRKVSVTLNVDPQ